MRGEVFRRRGKKWCREFAEVVPNFILFRASEISCAHFALACSSITAVERESDGVHLVCSAPIPNVRFRCDPDPWVHALKQGIENLHGALLGDFALLHTRQRQAAVLAVPSFFVLIERALAWQTRSVLHRLRPAANPCDTLHFAATLARPLLGPMRRAVSVWKGVVDNIGAREYAAEYVRAEFLRITQNGVRGPRVAVQALVHACSRVGLARGLAGLKRTTTRRAQSVAAGHEILSFVHRECSVRHKREMFELSRVDGKIAAATCALVACLRKLSTARVHRSFCQVVSAG